MVVRRPFGQRRQIGGFGDGQLVDRFVVVGERRAGDAVGAEAEEDLVDVELEDAVLRIGLLDAEGEDHLADLAVDGLVGRQQEVLGDLLGDRRGAHRPPAGAHILEVGDQRAAEADDVDAGVAVEILVLGRQERRLDAVGHRLDRQIEAPLARELAHQRAVGSVDARRHRRLVAGEHLVVRQILGQVADVDSDDAGNQQPEERGDAEEISDETYHARSSYADRGSGAGVHGSAEAAQFPIQCRQTLCCRYGQNTAAQGSLFHRRRIMPTHCGRFTTMPLRTWSPPPLAAGCRSWRRQTAAIAAAMRSAALSRQSGLRSCSSSLALER